MAPTDTTYAVVGGGIGGASIAYHLSERTDEPVTVFERRSTATETTRKSMAMYGLYGDETQYRMKRYGLSLYNEFYGSPRARPRYRFAGRLEVATTPGRAADLEAAVARDDDEDASGIAAGTDRDLIEYVDGDDLAEVLLLPKVDTSAVEGAVHRPRVGYVQPQELAFEFAARAKESGVRFETGTRVTDVTTEDGRATGIVTDEGRVPADEVVSAAGPWNVELARRAGIEIPVRHTLAPILKLRPPEPWEFSLPTLTESGSPYSLHVQTARDPGMAYLCYNPAREVDGVEEFLETYDEYDPDEMDETVPADVREGMWNFAGRLVPSLLDAEVVDEWVGIRSVTPDGNPVVGWTALPGFSIAGFHTSGIQLSPAVGRVIADQLVDGEPSEFYDGLSISRFEGYTDVHDGEP